MWTEESIKNYEELLESKDLPVIFDVEHLRRLIGVEKNYFYKLTNSIDASYISCSIDKRNGGKRNLVIPSTNLKLIQGWILENILYTQRVHDSSMGFVKGKSIVDNARVHLGNDWVFKTDITNFFNSITNKNVFNLFFQFGYSKGVAKVLADLCTYDGSLPQGAPTSPYISNLIFFDFDRNLKKICSSSGYEYTRYADDITISSKDNFNSTSKYFCEIITQLLQEINNDLKVNVKKTKVLHPGQRKIITGILVNEKLNVPKELISEIRLELYCLERFGAMNRLEFYNIKFKTDLTIYSYRQKLYGKICFVNLVNSEKAKPLYKRFYSINWMKR